MTLLSAARSALNRMCKYPMPSRFGGYSTDRATELEAAVFRLTEHLEEQAPAGAEEGSVVELAKMLSSQAWQIGQLTQWVSELKEGSSPPITESPTTDSPSAVAAASTAAVIQAFSQHHPPSIVSGLAERGFESLTLEPECHCTLCALMRVLAVPRIILTCPSQRSSPSAAPPSHVDSQGSPSNESHHNLHPLGLPDSVSGSCPHLPSLDTHLHPLRNTDEAVVGGSVMTNQPTPGESSRVDTDEWSISAFSSLSFRDRLRALIFDRRVVTTIRGNGPADVSAVIVRIGGKGE